MDLNWFESVLYGLFSGLMDILPVSAQAHRALLLKFFGIRGNENLLHLLIHFGVAAALYYSSQTHLLRMNRARSLARIPKNKRKRPLDTHSLMDLSLLKTMVIPGIIGLYFHQRAAVVNSNLVFVALFLFLNGIILYIPQFFPTGNRDSRSLSRVEGLLMGFGGAVSVIPGISAIATATAIGSVCGVEKMFNLNMAILMNLFLNVGLMVLDIMGILNAGLGTISAFILARYLVAAVAAFCGTVVGIKIMRRFAAEYGFSAFGVYCWGLALFIFILNLMA